MEIPSASRRRRPFPAEGWPRPRCGGPGIQVTAAVDSGTGLLAAVTADQPDVAIVDVRLPPTSPTKGSEPPSPRAARCRDCRSSVLSQYVEQNHARGLLADGCGGIGYLLKDRVLDGAQFAGAVRQVAGGGTAMDPRSGPAARPRLRGQRAGDPEPA